MSVENAGKLIERLTGNEELKAKFKKAGEDGFEKLAKDQGLPCTVEEFHSALRSAVTKVDMAAKTDAGALSAVVVSVAVV